MKKIAQQLSTLMAVIVAILLISQTEQALGVVESKMTKSPIRFDNLMMNPLKTFNMEIADNTQLMTSPVDETTWKYGARPANISSEFKGSWNSTAGSMFQAPQSKKTLVNEGAIYAALQLTKSVSKDYSFAEGWLVVRAGDHINDDIYQLMIVGLYDPKKGQMWAYMYPPHLASTMNLPVQGGFSDKNIIKILSQTIDKEYKRLVKEYGKSNTNIDSTVPAQNCVYRGNFEALKLNKTVTPTFSQHTHYVITEELKPEKEFYLLRGSLAGLDAGNKLCASELTFDMETQDKLLYMRKSIRYSIFILALTFPSILALIHQMKRTNTQSTAQRVSLLTVGGLSILDSYICIAHFGLSIMYPRRFSFLIVIALFSFILFSIFGLKYLHSVWKSRYPHREWEELRSKLSNLHVRYYLVMLLGFVLIINFPILVPFVLFALYSFWLPQIVMNFTKNVPRSLHPFFVINTSISRLSYLWYFWSCPSNFLDVQAQYILVGSITAYVALQSLVLIAQYILGARAFIPKWLTPKSYSYKRPLPEAAFENGECTCIICFEDLTETTDVMVTPCDHAFHDHCLSRWMEEKLECPVCRQPIPEM